MILITLGTSFLVSLMLVPVIRWLSLRFGLVAAPRMDRWHKEPTPNFGGVGMFLGFVVGILASGGTMLFSWGLLAGSAIVFALGLYDDLKQLTPPAKLVGQIMAAAAVVFSGYTTNFFSSALLNILITVVWLVGITNAINLIDNMDGLAGGIALIAAAFLSYFFWRTPAVSQVLMPISLALTGAILGFLIFNFPPAKIFMGDSGSLFLGFTLAALAIARRPQASNVFAVMAVPTLLFLIPILDTSLVTFTRMLRGQSPVQGGQDHTSHRLVAFGLTERQAVLVLYAVALASGVISATFESLDYTLSLVLIPILVVSFSLLAAYLGRLKVVDKVKTQPASQKVLTNIIVELTYKRRMLEIALDFFLISIAYYMSVWTRNGFSLEAANIDFLFTSLPVALGASYISFFVFGVYRGVWRYIGVEDLTRFLRAALVATVLLALVLLVLIPSQASSPVIFFLFFVFLFLGLSASRSSFKVLDQIYGRVTTRTNGEGARVLIYGAGDIGEMAVRWILRNPDMGYHVVGFLDDDSLKWGRSIRGVDVLGGPDKLGNVIRDKEVDGLILALSAIEDDTRIEKVLELCKHVGIWVKNLRLEFEVLA